MQTWNGSLPLPGAWIEIIRKHFIKIKWQSLPLPGAWIEIILVCTFALLPKVAPFTGSVDWNYCIKIKERLTPCRSLYRERGLKCRLSVLSEEFRPSLPLPGAWIEMILAGKVESKISVAPFTGSVDWNFWDLWDFGGDWRRSLYRERGLKYLEKMRLSDEASRSLCRECGLKMCNTC